MFACGTTDIKTKEKKCLTGKNEFYELMGQLVMFGYSNNKDSNGINTSIAPNDSGGVVIDLKLNEIIGVMWGTWTPFLSKFDLIGLSYSTPLTNKENLNFILNHL